MTTKQGMRKLAFLIFGFIGFAGSALPVSADDQVVDIAPSEAQWRSLVGLEYNGVIAEIIALLLIAATVVFLFIFLLAGIRWISSQGDEAKVKEARAQITQGVIGLSVVFFFWAVLWLIGHLFGVGPFYSPPAQPTPAPSVCTTSNDGQCCAVGRSCLGRKCVDPNPDCR